jgi:hypothetical protein
MSADDLSSHVDANLEPSSGKRLREAVSDAFTFIRSAELNQALATVTLEQLMGDQIARNGETERSNASQYDPYTYKPTTREDAATADIPRANFLGGSDTGRPTKLDRILAITNALSGVIAEIKEQQPVDVASPEEYADIADVAAADSEEESEVEG